MAVSSQEIHVDVPKRVVVLLGKTGVGKSATGNTLLRKKVFAESSSTYSFTQILTKHSLADLVVYDTTSIYNVGTEITEDALIAEQQMNTVLEDSSEVNAFILVLNVENRFSREELDTVELYRQILGAEFIITNGIIVMTHGENFEERDNFRRWIDKQTGYFQGLMAECDNRVVLVFNKGDDSQKSNCRAELFDKMRSIRCTYTLTKFNQNSDARHKYITNLNIQKFKAEFLSTIKYLKSKVEKLEKSQNRSELDIDTLQLEIMKQKQKLDELKKADEELANESKGLHDIYVRVTKIKSGCMII